jgi:hypothetical protein
MTQSIISKLLLWLAALVIGSGLIFLALTVQRSTFPYNSEGNYFDGVVNYHEQSIMFYGILSAASFLISKMLLAIRLLVQSRQQTASVELGYYR